MRTYRVYLDVAHADDQVTRLYGQRRFAWSIHKRASRMLWVEQRNDISDAAIALAL